MLVPPADFDPKAWINRALAKDEGVGDEPVDMRLSVLLTKLQLQATDVDAAIHDAALQVAAIAPQTVRDIASVRAQVEAVRGDMAALMEEVSGVEASSEISVALLREVLQASHHLPGGLRFSWLEDAIRELETEHADVGHRPHKAARRDCDSS